MKKVSVKKMIRDLFVKYPSIENHYGKKTDEYRNKIPADEVWLMTEKADGANFSVIGTYLESKQVHFAKRNSLLTPEQGKNGFFEYSMIEDTLVNKMLALMDKYPYVEKITVFGELIGCHNGFGENNKPEALKCGSVGTIMYTNKRGFLAFDVCFDDIFQPWHIVESSGFDLVPVIMEGTLDECLAFDVENFRTRIPHLYQKEYPREELPYAEGVVIKTTGKNTSGYNTITSAISHKNLQPRAILKIKHSKFSDRNAMPPTKRSKANNSKGKPEKTNTVDDLLKDLSPYINDTRLQSVISKEPTADRNTIIGLCIKDIVETYERDTFGFPILDKAEKRLFYQKLRKEVNILAVNINK